MDVLKVKGTVRTPEGEPHQYDLDRKLDELDAVSSADRHLAFSLATVEASQRPDTAVAS